MFFMQAECARADMEYTIDALLILEDRYWERGTAQELARGLDTPKKRRDYRVRYGMKWDWSGLGYGKWSALKCKIRYAKEEGVYFIEQRRRFGADWFDVFCNNDSHKEMRVPRLPVTVRAAEVFLQAVKGGADFAEAARAANGE